MILGKINFIFFFLIFFSSTLAEDKITTVPLINLENLKPSFEREDTKNESISKNKDINLKEKKSITYKEQIPGKQYSASSLLVALLLTLTLLVLKALEVKSLR